MCNAAWESPASRFLTVGIENIERRISHWAAVQVRAPGDGQREPLLPHVDEEVLLAARGPTVEKIVLLVLRPSPSTSSTRS
jgi:hypothetical protein